MNYPIYCREIDSNGATWTCRVIQTNHQGFQYSYLMRVEEGRGNIYELITEEVDNNPALIQQWLFDMQIGDFVQCTQGEFLHQLEQANRNINALIDLTFLNRDALNTKDNG